MADKKVTIMVIKVDLGCEKCKKKIKKILCNIPQIQNQIYDEKANTVTITVVCCSPEKIKKKICCKGGDTIKGIEIKEPEKPKPAPEKPKEAPKEPEKTKPPPEKPKEAKPDKPVVVIVEPQPKEPEKTKPPQEKPKEAKSDKPVVIVEPPKEKPKEKPKDPAAPPKAPEAAAKPPESASKPPAPAPKAPEPVPCYPPQVRACCMECYGGHGGGPCWDGYGRPAPCYGGYEAYGRPVYDSWGGGYGYNYSSCRRGCYVGRCDCLSEENPSACSVM
ncbi:protein PYRICULARIA ORYZAE RESISTANCE 21 [Ricinus communis]|uniref:HMA domain-containing protein n=1 Tax=Ricinus communis TaxID=3988 RepID=B9SA65_RICCO|nr:protein PYRICULARIA ORYZAE RESISTANCE 21 [Ricinus communis]EEF39484.1 conserved hypothetical protein [Ricinus communis]|eukprot:XP_002522884.1 protein PYRICULARIA ORYZAE RESISTANCE 21 [Ricinus communis]